MIVQKRKLGSILVVLFLIMMSSVEVSATLIEFNPQTDIQLYWKNISSIMIDLL